MADHVPQLEPKMLERIAALRGLPAVEAAFEVCAEEVERAMAEQIRISETESPTFAEKFAVNSSWSSCVNMASPML